MDPRLFNTLKKISLPLLLLVVMMYFLYHLMEGRYGIRSWQILKSRHAITQKHTQQLTDQVAGLEDKIKRLSPGTMDMDYAEELIREKTGLHHKNDLIIYGEEA